MLPPLNFLI